MSLTTGTEKRVQSTFRLRNVFWGWLGRGGSCSNGRSCCVSRESNPATCMPLPFPRHFSIVSSTTAYAINECCYHCCCWNFRTHLCTVRMMLVVRPTVASMARLRSRSMLPFQPHRLPSSSPPPPPPTPHHNSCYSNHIPSQDNPAAVVVVPPSLAMVASITHVVPPLRFWRVSSWILPRRYRGTRWATTGFACCLFGTDQLPALHDVSDSGGETAKSTITDPMQWIHSSDRCNTGTVVHVHASAMVFVRCEEM